jgi:pimeloyl-ACP methyl ester carboxylesterase
MSPESYRQVGAMFFESESLVDRLGKIDVPCLVLVGELDAEWISGADLFEHGLRHVHRMTLAGAEHHPHQENRAAFLAKVEPFLLRVASAKNA